MADFDWAAANVSGSISRGRLSAANAGQAARQLREQGLIPISIASAEVRQSFKGTPAEITAMKSRGGTRSAKGPATQADILSLTTELAIMLRAGLALDNGLRVLIDMGHKQTVVELLRTILDDVKGGAPLSRALGVRKDLFGDFYINMVRSGEASGQMSAVLDRLVEHMERLRALRESVISATIYPAILLGVAILSLAVMLGFVVPQFEKLFLEMGDALPLPTQIVMAVGRVFRGYFIFLLIGAVAAYIGFKRLLSTPTGQLWWQSLLLKMPLVGRLSMKYQLTLFTRSLGTLLGNGVPMLVALRIATETVNNRLLRTELMTIAPSVKEGGRVVDALVETAIFEPLAINLIRVGEETGRIGPMMLELANILNREVEVGIKRLLTLVEPILILVLGVLIASIIVSILLGILSVNDLAV